MSMYFTNQHWSCVVELTCSAWTESDVNEQEPTTEYALLLLRNGYSGHSTSSYAHRVLPTTAHGMSLKKNGYMQINVPTVLLLVLYFANSPMAEGRQWVEQPPSKQLDTYRAWRGTLPSPITTHRWMWSWWGRRMQVCFSVGHGQQRSFTEWQAGRQTDIQSETIDGQASKQPSERHSKRIVVTLEHARIIGRRQYVVNWKRETENNKHSETTKTG